MSEASFENLPEDPMKAEPASDLDKRFYLQHPENPWMDLRSRAATILNQVKTTVYNGYVQVLTEISHLFVSLDN